MSTQFCTRVGNNIKKYRKVKEMTLKELADKVGITEATMQKYEAGNIKKIDVLMLQNIANALEVRPENITEWENKEAYYQYKTEHLGKNDAKIVKMYNQLTDGHKLVVQKLIKNLIECQEKYNSDK